MDANESKIAEYVRLGIFFTNFSIRPSKMIKRHNFCKGSAWFSLTNDKGLGKSFSGWREEFQKFGEIFTPALKQLTFVNKQLKTKGKSKQRAKS